MRYFGLPPFRVQVYMFDGVGLNSQADPEPVKKEIQVTLEAAAAILNSDVSFVLRR